MSQSVRLYPFANPLTQFFAEKVPSGIWKKHYKVKAVDDKFGLIGFSAPLGLAAGAGVGGEQLTVDRQGKQHVREQKPHKVRVKPVYLSVCRLSHQFWQDTFPNLYPFASSLTLFFAE